MLIGERFACQVGFNKKLKAEEGCYNCCINPKGVTQSVLDFGANIVRAHERFPCGGRRSGH